MIYRSFEEVTTDRLGATCLIHGLSGILEYYKMFSAALDYLDFGFYYNREKLLEFTLSKGPDQYLDPENMLLFRQDTDLVCGYKEFYSSYMYSLLKSSDVWRCVTLSSCSKKDVSRILSNQPDPFMLLMNIEPLQDQFREMGGFADTGYIVHWLTIFGETKSAYWVKDKHYHICGLISKIDVRNAVDSLHGNNFEIINFNCKNLETDIQTKIIENFRRCLREELVIGENRFAHSVSAIDRFISDLDVIIENLEDRFGTYAPQYLSYATLRFRQQQTSYANAIRILHKDLRKSEGWRNNIDVLYSEICRVVQEIDDSWQVLDGYVDMVYMRKSTLHKAKGTLRENLLIIREKSCRLASLISLFVN